MDRTAGTFRHFQVGFSFSPAMFLLNGHSKLPQVENGMGHSTLGYIRKLQGYIRGYRNTPAHIYLGRCAFCPRKEPIHRGVVVNWDDLEHIFRLPGC